MKRIGCLYRVSTKKQTYNNDIPVQKNACRNFIKTKKDWKLEKEYIELGVSGYKLTAKERDVIQTIKKDVCNKEIDVLLVFMFDRIGRREEETPFVVEWLINEGIEVWSVNEGQRKIENRTDKLINYFTYWQASGESEKISLRSKEERIRLTKAGIYLGNYAPYGYKMEISDVYSKIGKRRRIPVIYDKEANVVKLIFELIAIKEYGTDKVAIYLNSKGIKRRKDSCLWDSNIILEIVRNTIYKGFVSFGKRSRTRDGNTRKDKSTWIIAEKQNPDIVIVSEELWQKANDLIDSRSRKGDRILRLLSGYTRCGYCGNHITPKGRNKYCYMLCKGKQKTGKCEYNKNYRVDILENIVINEIKTYLNTFKKLNFRNEIVKRIRRIKRRDDKEKRINQKISLSKNRISELKNNIISCLMLKNDEENKKLGKELEMEEENLKNLNNQLIKINEEKNTNNYEISELKEFIPNWSEEFDNAPLEIKRQILGKMIDKIYLYNGKIEIQVKYPISTMIIKEGIYG